MYNLKINQYAIQSSLKHNCDLSVPAMVGLGPSAPIAAGVYIANSAVAGCNYAFDMVAGVKTDVGGSFFGVQLESDRDISKFLIDCMNAATLNCSHVSDNFH